MEVPDPVPQEEYQEYQVQFLSLLVSLSISLSRGGRKSGGRRQIGLKPEATQLFFSALGLQMESLRGDGRRSRREGQRREAGGTR